MSSEAPQRPAGLELLGRYPDSGLEQPVFLVRRGDGQVAQLTELSYTLLARADGRTGLADLAAQVSHDVGRRLTPAAAEHLVDTRLRPAGLLVPCDAAAPAVLPRADPLLALRLKVAALPSPVVTAVARVLRPLFAAPAVVGAAVILLGLDTFLLLERPVTSAFSSLVGEPGAMALVGVLALLGVLWHEFGHATGCSAGGGRPGPIGVGVYIVWPVLYSDLTDTYRLTRRGRLMADGGGIYFSALWAIAAATAYLATGYTPLLALVVAQHVEMALQALPLLRFDGHYIVSDLIGVPDALSRVRPTLTAMLPGHRASRAVTELKPVARRLLRVYAIVTVPALACVLTVVALNVPSMASTAVGALTRAGPQLGRAFGDHDVPAVVGSLGLIVLALLPICGLLVIALLLVRKLVRVATPTPARLAPQLGEGVLIGIAVLYAFFYLGVGASSGAMGCALLIVCGLSFGLVRRRVFTHDSRDPALRRLRERRGF